MISDTLALEAALLARCAITRHLRFRILPGRGTQSAIYNKNSQFGRKQPGRKPPFCRWTTTPLRLRHQIWLTTDDAYKAAGQGLAEKAGGAEGSSALDPSSRG